MIITMAADKGGVGKTSLAYEVAYCLGAVLVDLDWSGGGATSAWGFDPRARKRAPLLDALSDPGAIPAPYRADGRPDLVPSHPDWGASVVDARALAERLSRWGAEWGRTMVLDTHPGFGEKSEAALMAADVVAVPVLLRSRELDALEEMLVELSAFTVAICPNCIPPYPPLSHLERLGRIVGENGTVVAPFVSEHRWWARRQFRAALTSVAAPSTRVEKAASELRSLATFLEERGQ